MPLISSSRKGVPILFLFAAAVGAAQDGERILRESVAAHGGRERFLAIRDWRIVADRKLLDESVTTEVYEEYLLRNGAAEKTLLVKKRGDSTLVFGHDGNSAFALDNGRLRDDEGASGEGYYRAHGEYYLRSLPFKWLDPGMNVEYAGEETTEGRTLDLLRIRAGENVGRAWKDVWVAAIDRETRLLWEARLTHHRETETWMSPSASGTTEIVYRYSDYRPVSGISFPHRLEYFSEGKKSGENVIRRIAIDSGVAAAIFSPETHRAR
ncbi:MAG TPA: hypothetical protein VIG29_00335 [Vicinamibacteria bacterium]